MAIARIGVLSEFRNDTTDATGNTSVTVPADAEVMVVGMSTFLYGTYPLTGGSNGLTLDGTPFSEVIQGNASDGTYQGALFLLDVRSLAGASRTLAWQWSDDPEEFVRFVYAFYKGADMTGFVRDQDGAQGYPTYSCPQMTTVAGDLVIGWAWGYETTGTAAWTWTGATKVGDFTLYTHAFGSWAEATASGTTIDLAAYNDRPTSDGGIVGVVLKPATGAPALSIPVADSMSTPADVLSGFRTMSTSLSDNLNA